MPQKIFSKEIFYNKFIILMSAFCAILVTKILLKIFEIYHKYKFFSSICAIVFKSQKVIKSSEFIFGNSIPFFTLNFHLSLILIVLLHIVNIRLV